MSFRFLGLLAVAFVLTCGLATDAVAQTDVAAWSLSDEERAIRWERVSLWEDPRPLEDTAPPGWIRESAQAIGVSTQEVRVRSGAAGTHLFFPWEVFEQFAGMTMVFRTKRVDQVRELRAAISGIPAFLDLMERMDSDRPEAIWALIEQKSGDYLDLLEETRRAQAMPESVVRRRRLRGDVDDSSLEAARLPVRSSESLRLVLCKSRADALERLRSAFGSGQFDRFLYESVGPSMFGLHAAVDHDEVLLDIQDQSKGCSR